MGCSCLTINTMSEEKNMKERKSRRSTLAVTPTFHSYYQQNAKKYGMTLKEYTHHIVMMLCEGGIVLPKKQKKTKNFAVSRQLLNELKINMEAYGYTNAVDVLETVMDGYTMTHKKIVTGDGKIISLSDIVLFETFRDFQRYHKRVTKELLHDTYEAQSYYIPDINRWYDFKYDTKKGEEENGD